MIQLSRIARFSLTTADAPALAAFYQDAFGCTRISADRQEGAEFEELMSVRGGAGRITLALGREIIELMQFDQPGAPYPPAATASDLCFQHLAIVVPDMARAWQRLGTQKGWRAITTGGPQKLPAASGDVTAFKFRDPESHPLEFLEFPKARRPARWQNAAESGPCQGIDHSAISISDSDASQRFFGALGLTEVACTQNFGPAQESLDGVQHAHAEVTAMAPAQPNPHLELLAYRSEPSRRQGPVAGNDIACTRILFESQRAQPHALQDPDGHRMILMPDSRSGRSSQSRS